MRLIDATDLVRRVLEERDRIMLEAIPHFEFAVANPERYKQAMHGGLRKALRCIEESPTIDAVSLGVLEQFKWERDTAISQLEELGIGFGQKMPDMVEVVRCRDCIKRDQSFRCIALYYGFNPHDDWFCAEGERDMHAEVSSDD